MNPKEKFISYNRKDYEEGIRLYQKKVSPEGLGFNIFGDNQINIMAMVLGWSDAFKKEHPEFSGDIQDFCFGDMDAPLGQVTRKKR